MGSTRFKCDPELTGNLTAEYEALQNDLEQARALAADYQHQLSDKSNDNASLKIALEKTLEDLTKLQTHIIALRQERHNLANEVMRVVLLESKVSTLTEENKKLREALETAAAAANAPRETRSAREPRREFIELGTEEPENLTVIPTTADPRAPGPYKPRW